MKRNEAILKQFIAYCKANPEQRFWQAIRNFSGFPFVMYKNELEGKAVDTFYFEGIRE